MKRLTYILPIIVIALIALRSSIFIVDEREKALVLQFGQIRQVREEPGIYFKIPFIQDIARYDDRILSLDTPEIEVTPSDDRRLLVDAFARYRITDVVRFRQAVGAGGIEQAESNLTDILIDNIRAVLGSEGVESNTILSSERASLMNRIRDIADARGEELGVSVVDVRLKTTNLPDQNLEETFARMRSERVREATDERARGAEAAQRVRAQADRTVVELTSDASREAEITRGEADAQRNAIFGQAYGQDEEFFRFYRSLSAYTRALQGQNSTLVITPDSEFFEFLDGASSIARPGGSGRNGTSAEGDAGAEAGTDEGAASDAGDGAASGDGDAAEVDADAGDAATGGADDAAATAGGTDEAATAGGADDAAATAGGTDDSAAATATDNDADTGPDAGGDAASAAGSGAGSDGATGGGTAPVATVEDEGAAETPFVEEGEPETAEN